MARHPASDWLYAHWNEQSLPNDCWVAVTSDGLLANNESVETVIETVLRLGRERDVVLAFVTFDAWQ